MHIADWLLVTSSRLTVFGQFNIHVSILMHICFANEDGMTCGKSKRFKVYLKLIFNLYKG